MSMGGMKTPIPAMGGGGQVGGGGLKEFLFEDASCGFSGKSLDFANFLYYEFLILLYATGANPTYLVNGKTTGIYNGISLIVNQGSGIARNRYDNQPSMSIAEGGFSSSQFISCRGFFYKSVFDGDVRIDVWTGDDRSLGFTSWRIDAETSIASFAPSSPHTGIDADSKIYVWGWKKQ